LYKKKSWRPSAERQEGVFFNMQALMIALYIAMDSFGTACNVTGDGAIAVVVDKIFRKDQ